jgi:Reverse transcriptase (RNA-dependent DNA polymerase)
MYIVYLDDILIFSMNLEDHHRHIAKVLQRLRKYGLYTKLSKCQFGIDIVNFLDYVLSPSSITIEHS